MKVTIKGDVFDTSLDWTFREEREVERLAGITRGQFWVKFVEGSGLPVLAAAVVGHMRAKPSEPREFLGDLKPGDAETGIVLDMSDEDDAVADPTQGPTKPRSGSGSRPKKSTRTTE